MRRFLAAGVVVLALSAAGAQAAVRASLDSDRIGLGDTVQLTLERDGQTNDQPDLGPLKQDFDVLSVGSSSNVQIVNGSISSETEAQVVLSPKHAGQLTIPPITWGGQTSPALSLTVANTAGAGGGASASGAPGGAGGAASATSPVFLETVIDDPQPYVQGAVGVTVRLYTAEQLYQASLNFPSDSAVLVQQVGGDSHSTAVRNGQQYQVVERHYVLFPQRSGALSVPGAVLEGQVPVRMSGDPFGGDDPFAHFFGGAAGMVTGTKPIRVHGDPIALEVRPRPAASGTGPWLPAQGLTLTGAWQPPSMRVQAGDPVTLDLHAQADGLTAAQLPDLSALLALPPGLKAYPDEPKLTNDARGDLVIGTRDQSLALIADRPGRYVIPALHLAWWDTKANQARTADLPAQTLDVLPAPGGATGAGTPPPGATHGAPAATGAATGQPASPRAATGAPGAPWLALLKDDRRWILISGGFAALWVGTLLGWWWSRRRPSAAREPVAAAPVAAAAAPAAVPPPPGARTSASRARAKFHEACRRNDAAAARRGLLLWVAAAWPDAGAMTGLGALAKRFADPRVGAALADLDRACYAGGDWNGAELAEVLKDLPKSRAAGDGPDSPIAPLYR